MIGRAAATATAPTSFVRRVARGAAYGVVGGATLGGTATAIYITQTESGLGTRRQFDFWSSVTPVVWDYWWNSASSSPKVKWQQRISKATITSDDADEEEESKKKQRKEMLEILHQRNALRIYHVMLHLGGLYIKLGQVLSVTALPIPDDYRDYFRSLQSNVPGHEDFEQIVKPTLEHGLKAPLHEIFESIDEIPCGAASIGQAHRATLLQTGEDVIVKVQYPNAKWQVPADIQCVGDFLKLCVFFRLVDESAAKLSYEEFSRQFLSELDYTREKNNLQHVYESSLDPKAPYQTKGVILPKVYNDLCTDQIITMTYLPGPKFEEEVKRQLAFLGLDTKKDIRDLVGKVHDDTTNTAPTTTTTTAAAADIPTTLATTDKDTEEAPIVVVLDDENVKTSIPPPQQQQPPQIASWKLALTRVTTTFVSVDSMLTLVRWMRKAMLWSTIAAVKSIQIVSPIVPDTWNHWAKEREHSHLQAKMLNWTKDAVYALLDVHGYQILNQGLFNADPHPGNIILMNEGENANHPKIGLIDYGQCKQLTPNERIQIAKLILSIANHESDEKVANHFREMGIRTVNNSTRYLAEFGRLMFGCFEAKHLDHSWHRELHMEDRVLYFPRELSMVYRTSLLLRGLAMSLQFNPNVGEEWRHHAQAAIDQYQNDIQT